MKFNFKIQQYQTDAVEAVARVFNGQGHYDKISYIRDLGKKKANQQMGILAEDEFGEVLDLDSDTGYKNEMVELSDEQLLKNIQQLQNENNIKMTTSLVKDLGRCSLDIDTIQLQRRWKTSPTMYRKTSSRCGLVMKSSTSATAT